MADEWKSGPLETDESVRKCLVELIRRRGFPLGFEVDYADASYGVVALAEDNVRVFGEYATDALVITEGELKPNLDSLTDLSLFRLAYGTQKDATIEEFTEDAKSGVPDIEYGAPVAEFQIVKDKYSPDWLLVNREGYVRWKGAKSEVKEKLDYIRREPLQESRSPDTQKNTGLVVGLAIMLAPFAYILLRRK